MIDYATLTANYAAYMPAVTLGYGTFPLTTPATYTGRPLPARLSFSDFNFLRSNGRLFYYDRALMSAGLALGGSSNQFPDPMITDRDQRSAGSIVLWDSGGYQIIRDKIEWRGDKTRSFILRACEHFADVAMTIDIPPQRRDERERFTTYEECLETTIENLKYYVKHRRGGLRPLFLNVLQGDSQDETNDWYNKVKNFPFEGWAFGGPLHKHVAELLRRLVIMCDEHMLDDSQWLHILGTNRLPLICAYTTIKKVLSEQFGKPIQVSCDSSSPFTMVYNSHMGYLGHSVDKSAAMMIQHRFPNDDYSTDDNKLPFPTTFDSVISKLVNLSDICLSDKSIFASSSWDALSYHMIANHNLEALLNAIVKCHDLYLSDSEEAIRQCPDWLRASRTGIEETLRLVRCREGIEAVLTSLTPMDTIAKYASDFEYLHKSNRRIKGEIEENDYGDAEE